LEKPDFSGNIAGMINVLTFDELGHLMPYAPISTNFTTLESTFVEPFATSMTRRAIFNAFVSYLTELKAALNVSLEIWVNCSFTTQKRDPNDVDFVIFVDKVISMAYKDTICQFRQRRFAKNSVTDGYFIETVPEEHPDYSLYQFDRQDWHRAFVFGRNEQKGYL
jgi:hypothetical protein